MADENKKKQAIALQYNPGDEAPTIVASGMGIVADKIIEKPKILATGKGYLADKIIEKAKEEDVPLYQDNQLANTLSRLEIGDMIPPELYGVVAEILVFVDNLDRLKGKINGK